MAPQTAKSLMKEFRASFRRKKVVADPAPKSNALKEADEEELAKLVELKENLGDQLLPCYSDAALLGFLRARSLNVKEAEKLLKVDERTKRFLRVMEFQPPDNIRGYNMSAIIGYDKEGSLVRLVNVGYADIKGLMHLVSTIDILKILMWMVERDTVLVQQESQKIGRKNNQLVFILNLEKLCMSHITYKPAFDSAFQALKLLQDHYHDVLKTVYFVNAPSFFSSVFKLFKPVIQDALHKKIRIFDHDNYQEELLKCIDADVLPKFMGGKRVDSNGDPRCSEFIDYGKNVLESAFASNFLDPKDPDVVVATIPAGATRNFRYPVRQVGSILRWHIQGKDNDIGVALYREPFQSGNETPRTRKKKEEDLSRFDQYTPIIRSQCHICPEEGSARLWMTGNIIVHFDNSYSWMSSKEVYFKLSVHPPSDSINSAGRALDNITILG